MTDENLHPALPLLESHKGEPERRVASAPRTLDMSSYKNYLLAAVQEFLADHELQASLDHGAFNSSWTPQSASHTLVKRPGVKPEEATVESLDLDLLLQRASFCGNLDIISFCVGNGGDPLNCGESGRNAVHYAAAAGQVGSLELLLDLLRQQTGVATGPVPGIDSRDLKCWTPLSISVCKDLLAAARVLIKRGGADCSLVYPHNCTPCRETATHSRVIHFAAVKANRDMFDMLVKEANCDPLDKDESGRIPLHYAVAKGNYDFVNYLIDSHPESVNVKDIHGRSAIHVAALRGWTGIVDLLLARGADAADRDVWSLDPFSLACNTKHTHSASRLATWLQDRGLPVPAASGGGRTVSLVWRELQPSDTVVVDLLRQSFPDEEPDLLARCVLRLGSQTCLRFLVQVGETTRGGAPPPPPQQQQPAAAPKHRRPFQSFMALVQAAVRAGTFTPEDLAYIKAAQLETFRARRRANKQQVRCQW